MSDKSKDIIAEASDIALATHIVKGILSEAKSPAEIESRLIAVHAGVLRWLRFYETILHPTERKLENTEEHY